jgi:hypothetical protein
MPVKDSLIWVSNQYFGKNYRQKALKNAEPE